jgi:two-component system, cell cycle sensor histidine kinase and response regulator CckA
MEQETIAHMYEPFYSKDKPGMGSGLGLSISYNIIQKHGGIIQVESKKGSGSCFTLYFPFCQGSHCSETISEVHASPVMGEGTILVIDDEQMVLKVARGFLEQCGYSVITTDEPDTGIQLFRERHPDISAVIIDLSMPGKTGLEVYRALRLINPGVRAILSSGMLDSDSKEQALALGIMDFVNKPYLSDELSARIKGLLSRS